MAAEEDRMQILSLLLIFLTSSLTGE